jgi:ribosomal protein S18 acetylase RimI-like enzyme
MAEPITGLDEQTVSIRVFRFPEDYSAVYTLWKGAGPGIQLRRSDEPGEIEKKLTRDPNLFLVAEVGDQIIGSVVGGYDGRRGMVYHLAVEKGQRERGIGSKLMVEIEERLRSRGCIRYYSLVTQDNHEALQFYEQRGWKRMELYAYGKDID